MVDVNDPFSTREETIHIYAYTQRKLTTKAVQEKYERNDQITGTIDSSKRKFLQNVFFGENV